MLLRSRMKYLFATLAALTLVACSGAPDYPAVGNGALANGTFSYLCTTEADAFCQGTQNGGPMPAAIAQGTTFRIAFGVAPGESDADVLLLGNEQLDLANDGVFTATHAGWATVFAQNGDGLIEDYANLHIVVTAALAIHGADATTTLSPGATLSVTAKPLDATGAVLAGSGLYEWETSDPNILTIDVSDQDRMRGSATLRAIAPGTARVRAVLGSATTTVDVLVGGA